MATTALLIAGTVISAISSIQQGAYQRKVANYNAKVLENEKVALQQKAELDVEKHRETVRRLKGSQRVATAASGIDFSGSPVDVLFDTEKRSLLDEKIIKYNAQQGIAGTESEIALTLAEGDQAYRTGLIDAGTTILSGAGKFYKSKNKRASLLS